MHGPTVSLNEGSEVVLNVAETRDLRWPPHRRRRGRTAGAPRTWARTATARPRPGPRPAACPSRPSTTNPSGAAASASGTPSRPLTSARAATWAPRWARTRPSSWARRTTASRGFSTGTPRRRRCGLHACVRRPSRGWGSVRWPVSELGQLMSSCLLRLRRASCRCSSDRCRKRGARRTGRRAPSMACPP